MADEREDIEDVEEKSTIGTQEGGELQDDPTDDMEGDFESGFDDDEEDADEMDVSDGADDIEAGKSDDSDSEDDAGEKQSGKDDDAEATDESAGDDERPADDGGESDDDALAEFEKLASDEDDGKKGKDEQDNPSDDSSQAISIFDRVAKDKDFAATKVKVDSEGTEMRIGDFVADYPEAAAMAQHLTQSEVQKAVQQFVPQFDAMQARLSQLEFWDKVTEVVPDAKTINKSKEFNDWMKTLPKAQQDFLSKNINHKDAITVFKAYKQAAGKSHAKKQDDKAAARRAFGTAVAKPKPAAGKAASSTTASDEFDAGFNEKDDD